MVGHIFCVSMGSSNCCFSAAYGAKASWGSSSASSSGGESVSSWVCLSLEILEGCIGYFGDSRCVAIHSGGGAMELWWCLLGGCVVGISAGVRWPAQVFGFLAGVVQGWLGVFSGIGVIRSVLWRSKRL